MIKICGWAGSYLDRVELFMDDGSTVHYGNVGGEAKPDFDLQNDEWITKVEGRNYDEYQGCGVTFTTNLARTYAVQGSSATYFEARLAKTRLCRRWEKAQLADGQACSFSGCTFAHGPSELRNVPGGGGGGGGGGRAGAGGCAGVRAGGMASRPARPARRPAASTGKAPPPPARGLPSGWAQYADAESGTPYYHCSATGVTQWVLP